MDVKINCLEVLEKELKNIKPVRILLGSTTEVYQPTEGKYCLTRSIAELLNKYNIPMIILTKSNLILRDIDILHKSKICFTINLHNDTCLRIFEPNSPAIKERINTVKILKQNGISAYVHIGPILPGFTNAEKIMEMCYGITDRLDFESFSFWMSPVKERYGFSSREEYNKYWDNLRKYIINLNVKYTYKLNFYFHSFKSYWSVEGGLTTF